MAQANDNCLAREASEPPLAYNKEDDAMLVDTEDPKEEKQAKANVQESEGIKEIPNLIVPCQEIEPSINNLVKELVDQSMSEQSAQIPNDSFEKLTISTTEKVSPNETNADQLGENDVNNEFLAVLNESINNKGDCSDQAWTVKLNNDLNTFKNDQQKTATLIPGYKIPKFTGAIPKTAPVEKVIEDPYVPKPVGANKERQSQYYPSPITGKDKSAADKANPTGQTCLVQIPPLPVPSRENLQIPPDDALIPPEERKRLVITIIRKTKHLSVQFIPNDFPFN